MIELFDRSRIYLLGDRELEILGSREKLAQWRHRNVGPAWCKIGRKVGYTGADLNAFIAANRVDPTDKKAA